MSEQTKDRRNMLKAMALTPLALATTNPLHAEEQELDWTRAELPENMSIVFQGDSITDAGRNKGDYYANHIWGMGNGYVNQCAAELLGRHTDKGLRIYNRGISGHKVFQLADRWREDCIMLRPNLLSLLIGVNDFWHTLTHGYKGTVEVFGKDLRSLLDQTMTAKKDTKLILAEPFVLKGGTAVVEEDWFPAFEAYQATVKKIAEEYEAVFLPYQSIFDKALEKADVKYWAPDGVHPSIAGCYLMRKNWLKAFYEIYI